jgi:hypothetical protein
MSISSRRWVVAVAVAAVTSLCAAPGVQAGEPWVRAEPRYEVAIEGGASVLGNSRSITAEHLLAPTVRLDAAAFVHKRLALGIEVAVTPGSSEGDRLLGVYLLGRTLVFYGEKVEVFLAWGAGLGTGPEILSRDLLVGSDITVWLFAGVDVRWTLVGDWLQLGVSAAVEHLSVVTATAGLVFRL